MELVDTRLISICKNYLSNVLFGSEHEHSRARHCEACHSIVQGSAKVLRSRSYEQPEFCWRTRILKVRSILC